MSERAKPLSIAIVAMGGQGGGVLANWLIDAAELSGCLAQSTAVPGVAQRTGATIYYLEIAPPGADAQVPPVLALMPVPGHVDILVAGELAEAGRALQRGLITPQRTAAIVSTHRDYAIGEKSAASDGRVDAQRLAAVVRQSAKRFVGFDMAGLASETGSVISSVLLGAIAGAGLLPFATDACERAIRAADVAVDANLRGFSAGCRRAQEQPEEEQATSAESPKATVPRKEVQALFDRMRAGFPEATWALLTAAVSKLIDYQDLRYAEDFLRRLAPIESLDRAEQGYRLTTETARYLALGMAYEDVIRVADLKTRSARFARVRAEAQAGAEQVVAIEEYMHPRFEEVCDLMPAKLGAWCKRSPRSRRCIGFFFRKGRRIRTTSLPGFLLLYMLAGLRRGRRGTLRFKTEMAVLEEWLALVARIAAQDYELAVEVAKCRQLVKGYGDTHARGLAHYQRIIAALEEHKDAPDLAAAIRSLRAAALAEADS